MTDNRNTEGAGSGTVNEGAIKGGAGGNYFFHPEREEGIDAGTGYSTAHGAVVEGERHQGGLMVMEAGTGADPHTHPNEQFIYITQGRLQIRVDDQETVLTEGSFAYVPPDTVHEVEVLGDEDVHFFTTKDLSHGIIGEPVDS